MPRVGVRNSLSLKTAYSVMNGAFGGLSAAGRITSRNKFLAGLSVRSGRFYVVVILCLFFCFVFTYKYLLVVYFWFYSSLRY